VRRTYDQYCSLARALDILGERWTLLVIRELVIGEKRFSDLLDGLPGIGANVLTARLKLLQEQGIVRRAKLPPPAGSTVYELTELGRELEPAVLDLARWGIRFMGPPRDSDRFRFAWLLGGLRAVFQPEKARGLTETYEFRVDGEIFWARIRDGELDVGQGQAHEPDVTITTDLSTFLAVGVGQCEPAEAAADGRIKVDGDLAAAARAAEILTLPFSRSADQEIPAAA
jgi:DNA-binding HxlR family transcriptional regulator/putative sterol carrier protein